MRIIEIDGKHLAFGLRWKPLISAQESYESLALTEVDKLNASLIWQDGKTPLLGAYNGILPPQLNHQPIYAAAHMLAAIPGCGPNVLLALGDPAGTHSLCGIFQGRPWGSATASGKNFDQVGLSNKELMHLIRQFAELCGNDDYTLLGNITLAECNPFTLTELARFASPASRMYQPRRRVWHSLIVWLLMGVCVATVSYALYAHWGNKRGATAAPKLSFEQQYEQSINARNQPLLNAPAVITSWFKWATALPLTVGGWHLKSIDCTVQPSPSKCLLNYERTLPQATQQTFVAATVPDWAEHIDAVDDKRLQVNLAMPSAATISLRHSLPNLPNEREIRLNFISQLQRMQQIAHTKLEDFHVYAIPAGVPAMAIPHPIKHAAWEVNGPLHTMALFETFPAMTSVTRLALTIKDPQPVASLKASSLMLHVKGEIYARD